MALVEFPARHLIHIPINLFQLPRLQLYLAHSSKLQWILRCITIILFLNWDQRDTHRSPWGCRCHYATQVIPFPTGKDTQFGRQRTGMMRVPPRELLGGFTFVMQWFWATGRLVLSESIESIHSRTGRGGAAFTRPPQGRLYKDSFGHNGDQCDCKQPRSFDRKQPNQCGDREGDSVQLFQGCISSVDTVIKNTQDRNDFARVMNIMCFETEAISVMDCVSCLPTRETADYADAHKNNQWHLYTALSAAACARELLLSLKSDFVTLFPLNISRDVVDRHMKGTVSNPNVFSGSEIEKLRQTRDSLKERYKSLHKSSLKELKDVPKACLPEKTTHES